MIKISVLIITCICWFSSCVDVTEFLPIEITEVKSLIIIPTTRSVKPFTKIYELDDPIVIEKILTKFNSYSEYKEGEKVSHNQFILAIRKGEKIIKYPLYFNQNDRSTKIKLFKNGTTGTKIGYYNCNGLFELVELEVQKYENRFLEK